MGAATRREVLRHELTHWLQWKKQGFKPSGVLRGFVDELGAYRKQVPRTASPLKKLVNFAGVLNGAVNSSLARWGGLKGTAAALFKHGSLEKIAAGRFWEWVRKAPVEKLRPEHTSNTQIAKEIAKDHLSEDKNYYQKLEKMEKKAALRAILFKYGEKMEKKALDIVYKDPSLLENTVGRVSQVLPTLIIRPQKFWSAMHDPRKEQVDPAAHEMEAQHPEELKDTLLYVGGTAPIKEKWKRIWRSRAEGNRLGVAGRVLGTLSIPATAIASHLQRADHYDPATDIATLYMGASPAIARHELGHAADFNRMSGWRRDLYSALGLVAPIAPFRSLVTEARATGRAMRSAKGLEDSVDAAATLYPAYGTYAGAAAAALAAPLVGPLGMPVTLAGAAGGHGIAALRNYLYRRKHKPAKPAATVHKLKPPKSKKKEREHKLKKVAALFKHGSLAERLHEPESRAAQGKPSSDDFTKYFVIPRPVRYLRSKTGSANVRERLIAAAAGKSPMMLSAKNYIQSRAGARIAGQAAAKEHGFERMSALGYGLRDQSRQELLHARQATQQGGEGFSALRRGL